MKVLSMLAISVTVKLHIRVAQQILKLMWKCLKALLTRRRPLKGVIVKYSRTFVLSSSRMASHQHPFLITPGSIIIIVRHATAVLSVLAVRCIQIPSSVTPDSWLLGRHRAGDGRDSVRQDRHYARKVALITSVMAVILPPIWNLLSLISLINLLFSLVMSLKVRRDRTQYPPQKNKF